MLALLGPQRFGERQHEGLRSAVDGHLRQRLERRGGGDVDDGAPAVGSHLRQVAGGRADQRPAIERDFVLEAFGVGGRDIGVGSDAGVVDQHVDRQAEGVGPFPEFRGGGGQGQVHGDHGDVDAVRRPQLRSEIVETIGTASHHDQVVAQRREPPGELGADPGRSPGDQSHHWSTSTLVI